MSGKGCFITLCGKSERDVAIAYARITAIFSASLKPSSDADIHPIAEFGGCAHALTLEFTDITTPKEAAAIGKAIPISLSESKTRATFSKNTDSKKQPETAFEGYIFIG